MSKGSIRRQGDGYESRYSRINWDSPVPDNPTLVSENVRINGNLTCNGCGVIIPNAIDSDFNKGEVLCNECLT